MTERGIVDAYMYLAITSKPLNMIEPLPPVSNNAVAELLKGKSLVTRKA
jgi:hypothetical protein